MVKDQGPKEEGGLKSSESSGQAKSFPRSPDLVQSQIVEEGANVDPNLSKVDGEASGTLRQCKYIYEYNSKASLVTTDFLLAKLCEESFSKLKASCTTELDVGTIIAHQKSLKL